VSFSFEVEDVVVKLFSDELVLLKPLISDVEDRVFVGGLIVHVEDDMGLGDRDDSGDVSRLGFDAVLADGDVHIGCIAFQQLHWSKGCEISH
jgi:hypothetical protein